MKKLVAATGFDNSNYKWELDKFPDECPVCHYNINPRILSGSYTVINAGDYKNPRFFFVCTRHECQESFIGYYQKIEGTRGCTLNNTKPKSAKSNNFSNEISKVSPHFVNIYNQATEAEAHDLDQISGIGFRKSLEFLIKDFLISEKPDEEENIRNTPLGACINDHIDDQRVKSSAKRAVWLGNDEAHYTRTWENKDVNDLKLLIRLTVNWIENCILTSSLEESMPSKKKQGNASFSSTTDNKGTEVTKET